MKRCSNCFKTKEETEFYRKLNSLQSRCKACNPEVVRSYFNRLRDRKISERWAKIRPQAEIRLEAQNAKL